MAEFGAQLASTQTERSNLKSPTIFDVLAQESLLSQLQPALKHVLRIIAEHNPARFGWVYRFADEICLTVQLITEQHHLSKYSASFSEHFYSLKRTAVNRVLEEGTADLLPRSCKLWSLFCLAVLPYIKDKCDKAFESTRRHLDENGPQSLSRLWRMFAVVYPYVHLTWQGSIWAFHLLYTVGLVNRHTPLLHLAGVRLQYAMPGSLLDSGESRDFAAPSGNLSVGQRLASLAQRLFNWLKSGLSNSLTVGLFLLQFIDWWYRRDTYARPLTSLAIPPPPPQITNIAGHQQLNTMCPLCNRIRRNDTALSVSGYVFCYTCIHRYISQHGCCPMTRYPARTQHLIRLYLHGTS